MPGLRPNDVLDDRSGTDDCLSDNGGNAGRTWMTWCALGPAARGSFLPPPLFRQTFFAQLSSRRGKLLLQGLNSPETAYEYVFLAVAQGLA